MKKLIIIALLVVGCSTPSPIQQRDFSLGCHTDTECELEDLDDMSSDEYQKELDDLKYWVETGRIR